VADARLVCNGVGIACFVAGAAAVWIAGTRLACGDLPANLDQAGRSE
jgi:hypothetical protein